MAAFSFRWEPEPAFGKMIKRLNNKLPLYRKIQFVMFAMVGEHHRHGGTKQRWQIPWTWANKKIMAWWKPDAYLPRIVNTRRWAADFYYGHGYRTTRIPEHWRRIRRMWTTPEVLKPFQFTPGGDTSYEIVRRKRKSKKTVAMTKVRAHNRRIRPRPAHEVWWTNRYVKRVEKLVLDHVLNPGASTR